MHDRVFTQDSRDFGYYKDTWTERLAFILETLAFILQEINIYIYIYIYIYI